jgi:hypothetical protein
LKVSDAELKELPLVTSGTRSLSAGELVDSAGEIPTVIGRKRALSAVQEPLESVDDPGIEEPDDQLDRVSS